MSNVQTLPCPMPDCGADIPFNPYELLKGTQFVCPGCQASIGLAPESRGLVRESMEKFEALKEELLKQKMEGEQF